MESLVSVIVVIRVIIGGIAMTMAQNRERSSWGGFFLGLLAGIIALPVIALLGEKE